MTEKKTDKTKLYWPTVVVLVALLAANLAVVLLLTGEDRILALGSIDVLGLTILATMRGMWTPLVPLLLAVTVSACGGVSNATRARYALEHARCQANQQEIVARQDTTYEEDLAALEAEIARCDAALHAIEVADGEGE